MCKLFVSLFVSLFVGLRLYIKKNIQSCRDVVCNLCLIAGDIVNKYTISQYIENYISHYIDIWHVGFDSTPI